jgi:hypothetical protein
VPLPLLAHQAPVLPLKAWRPAAFNGTALVLGSIAPDLEYLAGFRPRATGVGHSLVGQFVFCLPVTLAVVVLVALLGLGGVVAARFGPRAAWMQGAAEDALAGASGFARAAGSALCGSFSHVALDAFSHGVLPRWLPPGRLHLGSLTFSSQTIAQFTLSALGALIALASIRALVRARRRDEIARRAGAWALVLSALAGAALGVERAWPALRRPDLYFEAGRVYVWGYVAFVACCGAFVGGLAGAALLALRDRWVARAQGAA